jgi:hypothetical protein
MCTYLPTYFISSPSVTTHFGVLIPLLFPYPLKLLLFSAWRFGSGLYLSVYHTTIEFKFTYSNPYSHSSPFPFRGLVTSVGETNGMRLERKFLDTAYSVLEDEIDRLDPSFLLEITRREEGHFLPGFEFCLVYLVRLGA